jgi:hypothetical protein
MRYEVFNTHTHTHTHGDRQTRTSVSRYTRAPLASLGTLTTIGPTVSLLCTLATRCDARNTSHVV